MRRAGQWKGFNYSGGWSSRGGDLLPRDQIRFAICPEVSGDTMTSATLLGAIRRLALRTLQDIAILRLDGILAFYNVEKNWNPRCR